MRIYDLRAHLPPETTSESFSCHVLNRKFTRPLNAYFALEQQFHYWTCHLAEVSALVYQQEREVRAQLQLKGCTNIEWFNSRSTQAAGYLHENHACLVFRGTERAAVDWYVNLNTILCGSPGRHQGFHLAFKAVEHQILDWLPSLPSYAGIITSGHSLGGALAILSAFELENRHHYRISAVRTFGAPRVGSAEFARAYRRRLASVTWRFKCENDFVTIIPPPPLFIHVGSLWFLKDAAQLRLVRRLPYLQPSLQSPLQSALRSFFPRPYANPKLLPKLLGPFLAYEELKRGCVHLYRACDEDPSMTLILAALTIVCFLPFFLLYLASMISRPGHLIHFSRHFVTTTLVVISVALATVSVVLFQQLTYLIPRHIPLALRWVLSIAAVIAITRFQINLAWIIPALLLSFVFAVFALHFTRPSVEDHDLDRYCALLRRAHSSIPAQTQDEVFE